MTTKTQIDKALPQIVTALEKNDYLVRGPEDIAALAAASLLGEQVPSTYLRVLVASVQVKSGMESPRHSAYRGKVPAVEDVAADLTLISDTHQEFYGEILKVIVRNDPSIADEKGLRRPESKRRAKERNDRSNKFRQSKSVLSKFVKAGGNIRTLCVQSVTKQQLRGFILQAQKGTEEATPQQEAAKHSARIIKIIEGIREESDTLAQLTIQETIGRLAGMFDTKTTTSAHKAVEQGMLLKVGGNTFWPASHEAHMTQ